MTATNNFALRLQASVMEELRKVVAEEGTTLNQFINVAVAEKLAALRTVEYFRERAERANMQAFWDILEQAGNEPPRDGDELPETWQRYEATRRAARAAGVEGETISSAELRDESRTP